MGYIKEPEGVDFVINGKPLTEQEKQEISEYIRAEKERMEKSKTKPVRKAKSKQQV